MPIVALYVTGNAIYYQGQMVVSGSATPSPPPAVYIGTYRFLREHYYRDAMIPVGTIQSMFSDWTPTHDVEPMDSIALTHFYALGPTTSALIRQVESLTLIQPPVTFWNQIGPNLWKLTGLGSALAPVPGIYVQKVDDMGTK